MSWINETGPLISNLVSRWLSHSRRLWMRGHRLWLYDRKHILDAGSMTVRVHDSRAPWLWRRSYWNYIVKPEGWQRLSRCRIHALKGFLLATSQVRTCAYGVALDCKPTVLVFSTEYLTRTWLTRFRQNYFPCEPAAIISHEGSLKQCRNMAEKSIQAISKTLWESTIQNMGLRRFLPTT